MPWAAALLMVLGLVAVATPPAEAQVSGSVASADPVPAGPTKGSPAPQPARPAAPTPACDLTDPDSSRDEFLDCVSVDIEIGATPAVGETTTGRLTVKADVPLDGAVVTLAFNENFSLVAAPGFGSVSRGESGVGPVTTVARSVSLAPGGSATFSFTARAESRGFGIVQAAVDGGAARKNANDEAVVQLGAGEAPSRLGGYAVEAAPADVPQAPVGRSFVAAPVGGPRPVAPSAPGASCATGRWVYNNELGQQVGAMNYQVQVWDQDPGGADDQLAVGVAGGGGNYNICFESTDSDGGGGQEVYLRFVSANNAWKVRNTAADNNTYDFTTGVIAIADPGTANFGILQPSDPALFRALHAFDGLNQLYLWQSGVNGACMDDPGQCRQMVLNWTPTSTDGTYYLPSTKDIHLDSNDPDSDHITIHEGSHALMDALFEDDFPPSPNCNPHFIFGVSSTGCAWTEGWAEWVPARVLNDPFFRFEDGTGPNLEAPSWTDGQAQGDAVEGRVAGALIDLSDTTNDGPWDRYSEGGAGADQEEIYTTMVNEVSDTLNEYFNVRRPGEGDTGYLARAAVFQNTIDYNHRDPLFSSQQLTRPSLSVAPSPHNYSYNTTTPYWSGVAIRGGNDNDLSVYDDAGQSSLLASSALGGNAIDYVLVDSNHRATGDYYPRVGLFAGSGPYTIELDAGSATVGEGSASLTFGSGDVINVRDAFVNAGVTNYVRVVPTAGLDVEVTAHRSDQATPATLAQGRSSAVAGSSSGGAGAAEAIQYSAPTSDWMGLVFLNRGGAGSATVYRDESAPTGTVTIDGGASSTSDRSVDLTLSAGDSQTGIMDMRVSVDGTFDTETWEPYATAKTVSLPAGAGTKTVTVQFRNNAGAVTTASDTITLVAAAPSAPTVTSSTPSQEAVAVAFAPGDEGSDPITSFTAQCASTDGGTTSSKTGAGSPLQVTNLTAGKNYRCRVRATNAVGSGAYSAYGATVLVTAATPPGTPTVTGSVPSGGSVEVAFTAPASDSGRPITNYTAQCASVDGGNTSSRTGPSSPLVVSNLTAGKSYRCRVRATNSVGTGAFGAYGPTVLVPNSAPGAPIITGTAPSSGGLRVSFSAPGSDGGSPITAYTAQCVSTDGGGTSSKTGPGSPLQVSSLTAGRSYRCRARATNAIGTGPFSAYGQTVVVAPG